MRMVMVILASLVLVGCGGKKTPQPTPAAKDAGAAGEQSTKKSEVAEKSPEKSAAATTRKSLATKEAVSPTAAKREARLRAEAAAKEAAARSVDDEVVTPAIDEPVVEEVVVPAVDEPVVEEVIAPPIETPAVEEPVVEEVVAPPVIEEPVAEEVVATPIEKPVVQKPVTPPPTKERMRELVWSGATIRIGMNKQQVLTQIEKEPKKAWFAVELDGPPYGELHKMDKWILAYSDPEGLKQGGVVTLFFTGGVLSEMKEGQAY